MTQYFFVDTSFFKAYTDVKDDFHTQALQIFQKLKGAKAQLVTSNFILDESFTVIRSKRGLEVAKQFKKILEQFDADLKIMRVLVTDEAAAWEYFIKDWSKLSFTDCVSFAMMKRLDIRTAVSFDNHFERAGYKLIS
ncbi:hypothetical protein A3B42_02160 [Candidatus Daviesbacteria bacterium RIFCSPLOWO2_01_FULL_38_10]|nr:MAG: hypothetical protein A3B42_02160 [Candidatus Daviesbacteria bacterium RIFCSPLOWO2_01_FULL_38_10]HCB23385.1 VapC toxin family PIN domain ribonuclease [Candidatus Daviesbacteria bacterium]